MLLVVPCFLKMVLRGACARRLCKSSNRWESANTMFLNIGRIWQKLRNEFNFANNNTVTVFLIQRNKIFAVHITISPLSLVHDDAFEKMKSFTICNDYVI